MTECEKYQEMLSALLDGELSEAEQAEVQAHMASCPDCRGLYEAFAAVAGAAAAEDALPDTLHSRIMTGVMVAAKAKKAQHNLMRLRTVLVTAACLVVVVGTVFALKGNLLSAKSAAPEAADTSLMMFASTATTGGAAEDESCAAGGTGAAPMEAPMPASENGLDGETQKAEDCAPGAAIDKNTGTALLRAWRLSDTAGAEPLPVEDLAALAAALEPQPCNSIADPNRGTGDDRLTVETADGTVRELSIFFDGERVWVLEDGCTYLAACTPEEFKAIK